MIKTIKTPIKKPISKPDKENNLKQVTKKTIPSQQNPLVLKKQTNTLKEESFKEHFQGNSQSISYFQGIVKDDSHCSIEDKLVNLQSEEFELQFSCNSESEHTDRKATDQSEDKKESPLEIEQILMQHDNQAQNAQKWLFNDCHVVIVEESSSAIWWIT